MQKGYQTDWKESATVILAGRFPSSQCSRTSTLDAKNIEAAAPSSASSPIPTSQLPLIGNYTASPRLDLSRFPSTQDYEYKLLMLKRSSRSKFWADAYVFPGGMIDKFDFSTEWTSVFCDILKGRNILKGTEMDWEEVFPQPANRGCRPPILTQTNDGSLPLDVAFRICAIRETFEESGVLLCIEGEQLDHLHSLDKVGRKSYTVPLSKRIDPRILSEWKSKVTANAANFIKMCRELGILPNIWSLCECRNWLTPSDLGPKFRSKAWKFDTVFYLCCLPNVPPHVHDSIEITGSRWCTPVECLEDFVNRKISLGPPQFYEIASLAPITSYVELCKVGMARNTKGCERWIPFRINCADGVLMILPGDNFYPPDLEKLGEYASLSSPEIMERLRNHTRNHNRFEITVPDAIELYILCSDGRRLKEFSPKL